MAREKVICELIAQQEGFINQKGSNISSWYGFENEKKQIAQFKATSSTDAKNNYNFYKGASNFNEVNFIYLIIVDDNNIFYSTVNLDEFTKTNNPVIKVKKITIQNGKWKSPIIEQNIIEQITSVNDIYNRILYRKDKEEVDKKAIDDLVKNNLKICHYCGIDIKTINILNDAAKTNETLPWYHGRGLTKRATRMTLEVDQLNPNKGYINGNIVWACSWCNNAKTDTFTEAEFKNIAFGINDTWNKRLEQIKSIHKVNFP